MAKYKVGDQFKGNTGGPFEGWIFTIISTELARPERILYEFTYVDHNKSGGSTYWQEISFDTYTTPINTLKSFVQRKLEEKGIKVTLT